MVSTISTSMRSAEEISFLTPNPLTPSASEERDSGKRTMGVVSMVMDYRAADDDVSQLTQDIEKNYCCKSYTPPRPARNGTPTKGRWGWSRW